MVHVVVNVPADLGAPSSRWDVGVGRYGLGPLVLERARDLLVRLEARQAGGRIGGGDRRVVAGAGVVAGRSVAGGRGGT